MRYLERHKKKIAFLFFWIMASELLAPLTAHALTSGPVSPEMKGFEPIGASDMVDLFSGDFSYNIPLMDVGGYPLTLNYRAGAGMDDEASWVGYGWSLGPGNLNRQVRGLPDDFNGTDALVKENNFKDHITKGLSFKVKADFLGIPGKKGKVKKRFAKKVGKINVVPSLGFDLGVEYDNYRGIGTKIGLNAGLSVGELGADPKTAKVKDANGNTTTTQTTGYSLKNPIKGSLGISSSSMDGANANLNFSILRNQTNKADFTYSGSIGLGYNSRAGLQALTLSNSFNPKKLNEDISKKLKTKVIPGLSDFGQSSYISFANETFNPTIDHPVYNKSFTASVDLGVQLVPFYLSGGITGYYSKQFVPAESKSITVKPYGFLYSAKGKNVADAVMDFNREKDIPYSQEVQYLPVTIPTYDLFTASTHDGGGQYHLYQGGSGVFFDRKVRTGGDDFSFGLELGFGLNFDVGADIYYQSVRNRANKWVANNDFLAKGDFQDPDKNNPGFENVYFKRVGEPVPADMAYYNNFYDNTPIAVKLKTSGSSPGASDRIRLNDIANKRAFSASAYRNISLASIKRNQRDIRNEPFSYLTAGEAQYHALEKEIRSYQYSNTLLPADCNTQYTAYSRTGDYRKNHHLSEITITGNDGKRTIYGIPVYNTYEEQVSFSVSADTTKRKRGVINYSAQDASTGNQQGREGYYSRDITPPYANAYLLTAILSPDYRDKTGDGITDDDLGTAVKFNYSKLPYEYRWRAPYDSANYNEGFLSDNRDDKANYTYGRKEVWYLHTIESKTMIAQFVVEDREDGFGVSGVTGGKDTTQKLKRLTEIRLFSKSDLKMNNGDLSKVTPVKVVHFVYDYSTSSGIPNSNAGGKLTLKKVYFTFGYNNKGVLHPYTFEYNAGPAYQLRQYDKWGNYKDPAANPAGLNNSEFPYTLQQDSATNAQYAGYWQLNKINLPSGGSIKVTYESDDYGYVQDKRSSQMCFIKGVGSNGSNTGLINADKIYVDLPSPLTTLSKQELKFRYFQDIDYLYFKCFLDLDNQGHKEFVPGYAKVIDYNVVDANTAEITLEKEEPEGGGSINPIAHTGWQFIKSNLPKYAYPGYENLEEDGSVNFKDAVKSLVYAFRNLKELLPNSFSKKALSRKFSDNIDLQKSWVRLCSPDFKKYGGGSRVKTIEVSDEWAAMSQVQGAKTSSYKQVYSYTTTIRNVDGTDKVISSGVASYEPTLGGDENPFRQPVFYRQKVVLQLDNYYYIEKPFGESLFPAPSVGYSKVSVTNIGTDETETKTGTTVSEFYTAKDFPTKTSALALEKTTKGSSAILKILVAKMFYNVGLSQGFTIENNDMHGKPKKTTVYNKGGGIVSMVEYFYRTDNNNAETRTLNNKVAVMRPDGSVGDGVIGYEVDMFSDMRESLLENKGSKLQGSGGLAGFWIFSIPFFFPGPGGNWERKLYRASSTTKIIQRFGILDKVKKTENGSSITTENLVWDAVTGDVLLSKTQNEFDDPVYSFSYPAHWAYESMGQAYQNIGTYLDGFSSGANGEIPAQFTAMLIPGDELVNVDGASKYWVINSNGQDRIIDADGNFVQVTAATTVKVLRSGRRNTPSASIASITSLQNPVINGKLTVGSFTKVLDAKATVYNEAWSMPVPNINRPGAGPACLDATCLATFIKAAMGTNITPANQFPKTNLFAYMQDNETAGSIMNAYIQKGQPLLYGNCLENFNNGMPADSFAYYLYAQRTLSMGCSKYRQIVSGDSARLGECKIVFDYVNNDTSVVVEYNNSIDFKRCDYVPPCNGLNSCGQPLGNGRYTDYRISCDSCGFTLKKVAYNPQQCTDSLLYNVFHVSAVCDKGSPCLDPVGQVFNPYFTGVLGNWRPQSSYAYNVDRESLIGNDNVKGSTNIRKSGAYTDFTPFWVYNSSLRRFTDNSANDARWIQANTITYFNDKGLELENKDALNRYSAAQFGYLQSVPVAVASNAQYREIGYDGFEDYGFELSCKAFDSCNAGGHFNFSKYLNNSSVSLSGQQAHTGKYSLKVNGTVTMVKNAGYLQNNISLFTTDATGRYILGTNELLNGFSPLINKKYVLSFWVKDNTPRAATTPVQVKVNGTTLFDNNLAKWPVVEGWKRIETTFTLSSVATNFVMEINSGGGEVYVDDIRIHPFDGQMKSYAYDATSQRLMADLDENNFATFYEYDDEGILVRVKKETERGIMTIKETRSSYKKTPVE